VEVEATTSTSPSKPSTHALVTPTRRTARARSRAATLPGTVVGPKPGESLATPQKLAQEVRDSLHF
jgi:hypothetical protein